MKELHSEFIDKLADKYTSHLIEVEKLDMLIKIVDDSLNDHSQLWITAITSIIAALLGAIAGGIVTYRVEKCLLSNRLEQEKKEAIAASISYLFTDFNYCLTLKKSIKEDIQNKKNQQYSYITPLFIEQLPNIKFLTFNASEYFHTIFQAIFQQKQLHMKISERDMIFEKIFLCGKEDLESLIPNNTEELQKCIDDTLATIILSIRVLIYYMKERQWPVRRIKLAQIPNGLLPDENLLVGRGFDDIIEKVRNIQIFQTI